VPGPTTVTKYVTSKSGALKNTEGAGTLYLIVVSGVVSAFCVL